MRALLRYIVESIAPPVPTVREYMVYPRHWQSDFPAT